MNKIINISAVIPNDNYSISIAFEDGLQKTVSVLPFIKNGMSSYLSELDNFKTVKAENGYVVWANGFDLCPVFLRQLPDYRDAS